MIGTNSAAVNSAPKPGVTVSQLSQLVDQMSSRRTLLRRVFIGAIALAAVLAVTATFQWEWALELSSFSFALAKVALALTIWAGVDHFILHSFNTLAELKRGNVAVAIVVVGLLGLIGLCVASA